MNRQNKTRCSRVWNMPKEQFCQLVGQSSTIKEIAAAFGTGGGWGRKVLERIQKDKMDISHIRLGSAGHLKPENLTGQIFGRLIAFQLSKKRRSRPYWVCRCACGNEIEVRASDLKYGETSSCGCFRQEEFLKRVTTHGMSNTREYKSFCSAKNRCNNPNYRHYADYGGRGIKFKYTSFDEFLNDVGPRPSREHSLDRKKVDGHYEPGNCRWATRREQYLNRRTMPISRQELQQWFGDDEGLRIWNIVSNKVQNKKGSVVFV